MPNIKSYLEKIDSTDKNFIGTITFRSEEICLPDESKMALGIDDGHWVLIYQKNPHAHLQVFKYDQKENKIFVDQKAGGSEDFKTFRKHVEYFFKHAKVQDLITLLPPQGG